MTPLMEDIRNRIWPVVRALLIVAAIGICGYHFIEGWSLLDSAYMTVITLSTVGYGETHPLDPAGRVFTIFLIFFGIGAVAYAVSALTAFIVEGQLKDALRRNRMEAKIAKLSGHYILCGAGHAGQVIIDELTTTGKPFVVIDADPDLIGQLQDRGILAMEGDAANDAVLQKAGIDRARGLFGALPTDPDNAFVSLSARGLNPKLRIVCQQRELGAAGKLKRSGADAVVSPGFIGGLRMASEMLRPAAVGFLDAMLRAEGAAFRIEEITVPENSPLNGKPLEAVKGAGGDAALLLAVKKPTSKSYDLNPSKDRPIQSGELLVVMGSVDHLRDLQTRLGVRPD